MNFTGQSKTRPAESANRVFCADRQPERYHPKPPCGAHDLRLAALSFQAGGKPAVVVWPCQPQKSAPARPKIFEAAGRSGARRRHAGRPGALQVPTTQRRGGPHLQKRVRCIPLLAKRLSKRRPGRARSRGRRPVRSDRYRRNRRSGGRWTA